MSDALKAQAGHLQHGIDKLDAEAKQLEGTLAVIKADRQNMQKELEAIERFLRGENQ